MFSLLKDYNLPFYKKVNIYIVALLGICKDTISLKADLLIYKIYEQRWDKRMKDDKVLLKIFYDNMRGYVDEKYGENGIPLNEEEKIRYSKFIDTINNKIKL